MPWPVVSFSHFGPEANLFDKLEELFRTYSETLGPSVITSTAPRRPQSTTRASVLTSAPASSLLGRTFPPGLICSSTKACTVV